MFVIGYSKMWMVIPSCGGESSAQRVKHGYFGIMVVGYSKI